METKSNKSYRFSLEEFPWNMEADRKIREQLRDYRGIYGDVYTNRDANIVRVSVDEAEVRISGDTISGIRSPTEYEEACLSRTILDLLSMHVLRLEIDHPMSKIVLP